MPFNVDPRRQRPRVYFTGKEVQIETDSGHKSTGQLMDLSVLGVGVVSSAGYFEGDKVDISFDAYEQHFHFSGEVKRVTGKELYIKFGQLTSDEMETITHIVEQHGSMKRPPKVIR